MRLPTRCGLISNLLQCFVCVASPLEQQELKAMTCDMILRDLVPAAMLDRHVRLVPRRFEAHVKLRRLAGGECRLTPCEH